MPCKPLTPRPAALLLPLLLLLAVPPLFAQGGLKYGALPAGFEWIEASSRTHKPFGMTGGVVQQVYPPVLLPVLNRMSILKALKIRRDRQGQATAAFWVECEMGLSSYGGAGTRPSPTFAANRDTDYRVVYTRKRLNLAATRITGTGVQPWLPPIPLDAPFIFDRSKGKGLLWEVRVHRADPTSPGSAFTLDAHAPLSISLASPAGTGGQGCAAATGLAPLLCRVNNLLSPVSRKWQVTLANCPSNAPVLIALGRTSAQVGALSLPLDLGPLGAPGCKVHTEPLVWLPATATAAGLATLQLTPVSFKPGFPLYAQGYVVAPRANALGLATSNGAVGYTQNTIATAWVTATAGPTATAGKVETPGGIVLGLDFL